MAENWQVTPSTGVQNLGNGKFKFPSNKTENEEGQPIIYTVSYTGNNGCTAKTTVTVPHCKSQSCEDEWKIEKVVQDPNQIFVQNYTGYGGTPFQFYVKHNGQNVTNLTVDDFEFLAGPDGQYGEAITEINMIQQGTEQAPYVIQFKKSTENVTCQFVGITMLSSIALKACPNAKTYFLIKIEELETYTLTMQNVPTDICGMTIQLEGYVGVCNKKVTMNIPLYKPIKPDSPTGCDNAATTFSNRVQLYKNLQTIEGTPYKVKILSIPTIGTHCQSPDCAKIIEMTSTSLKIWYCGEPCQN